jgi:hypothetical protein
MRAAALAIAALACGCNAIFGLDPTSLGDDELDGGTSVDGAAADARTSWDTPVPLEVAATTAVREDDPAMGPGGLELYWSVSLGGDQKDIHRSTRLDTDEPFVASQTVIELSSVGSDATVRISADGMTLYMASDISGAQAGDLEILTAQRTGPSWTGLGELGPPYSSPGSDHAATPCGGGSRIVVASTREGLDHDIFEISKDGVTHAVATGADEISPFITEDCLTLYFAADLGEGNGRDIYVTTRDEVGAEFGPPQRVEELSSRANEEDPFISADGSTFLFATDRAGDWDIWESRMGR